MKQFLLRNESRYASIHHYPHARSTAQAVAPDILNGNTVSAFLRMKYSGKYPFGFEVLVKTGRYKIRGWVFDFRNQLDRYFVETDAGVQTYFAPDQTLLSSYLHGKGKIIQAMGVAA